CSLLFQEHGPVTVVRPIRRCPLRPTCRRQYLGLAGPWIEPGGPVLSWLQFNGGLGAAREVDRIDLARLRKAIAAVAHQLIVRVGFPPVKAGEEIHDTGIAL